MAILQTTTAHYHPRGRAKLELTPNSPTQHELVDSYVLRLWVHDQLIYDRIHSVRNWQMRHLYVERIARAFCCIRELVGKQIRCASENTEDDQGQPTFISFVCAQIETDWLKVMLSAAPTKRYGDVAHVVLFLQQTHKEVGDIERRSVGEWGEWDEMICATILCGPEDAIAFGTQLLGEIHTVEQERIALGIPEYDDPSYSE